MSNPTTVRFTLPTTNTDGTALDRASIIGVKVNILNDKGEVGVSNVYDIASLNPSDVGDCVVNLPTLPSGNYSVVLYTEATSQGQAVESASTVPVTFVIAIPSIPNPPLAVSVA